MQGKKIAVISVCAVLVLALLGAGAWYFFFREAEVPTDPTEIAYVTPVSEISTSGGIGMLTRFTGVVEPQKTLEVQKDETKKVAKLHVTVGQAVDVGDPLFSYDMEDLSMQLQEAELQLESFDNRITTLNKQVETLTKEQKSASKDDRLSYTLQIQSTQLEIRSTEYDRSVKAREIEQLQSSLLNTDVTAEMAGIVQSITDSDSNSDRSYESDRSNAYITILSTGQYRIKATVSELNINSLYEGMEVNVISRVDPQAVRNGYVDAIEREPISNSNNSLVVHYGSEDSFTPASKYNFYVLLDNFDGLMLGQHVYVEPSDSGIIKTGLWLPGYYIETDGSKSYVWAANDRNTLERREVSLGQYDEEMDEFEVLSGLNFDDSIAIPDGTLHNGMYAAESGMMDPSFSDMPGGNSFDEPYSEPVMDVMPEEVGGADVAFAAKG